MQPLCDLPAAPDRGDGGNRNNISDMDVGDHRTDFFNAAHTFVTQDAVRPCVAEMCAVYIGSTGQNCDRGTKCLERTGFRDLFFHPAPTHCGFDDAVAFHDSHN